MNQELDEPTVARLFTEARTHSKWHPQPVDDATLTRLYELVKWGPTSTNCSPLRVAYVRSSAAKERLLACMKPGNVEKTRSAPVTAILGYDLDFPTTLPALFPHNPAAAANFAGKDALIEETALRNSSLQGGYFILAARLLGLDCGPMQGFDASAVDREFFSGTQIRTNFICNLGYGDASGLFPRAPRLPIDTVCRFI